MRTEAERRAAARERKQVQAFNERLTCRHEGTASEPTCTNPGKWREPMIPPICDEHWPDWEKWF